MNSVRAAVIATLTLVLVKKKKKALAMTTTWVPKCTLKSLGGP